jgi:Kef-type K+ transport system membrane component KefB
MRHGVVFFVALFVVTGTRLSLDTLFSHLALAVLLVATRSGLQILTGWLLAPGNGLSRKDGALLGLGLMPMTGNSVSLLLITSITLGPSDPDAISLLLAMLCLTEIIGPILTRAALTHAREIP